MAGFNLGSVFSPEMLRMVDAEKERRNNNLGLQATLYRQHEDDKFRKKQLDATINDQNSDRASRERMATDATDTRQQLKEMDLNARTALAGERNKSAYDILAEKQRQFDSMLPVQRQKADAATERAGAATTNAGARSDQVGLNREIQFGSGDADNPTEGSLASGRRVTEGKTYAETDLLKKRAEAFAQQLKNATDNIADQKRRTDILAAGQDLHERAFRVKSTQDAEALAIDLVKAMRNPVTGMLSDAESARVNAMLTGQVLNALEGFGKKYVQAFSDKYQSSMKQAYDTDVHTYERTNNQHGDGNAAPTGDTRAKAAMDAIEKARARTRELQSGQPPSNVGR